MYQLAQHIFSFFGPLAYRRDRGSRPAEPGEEERMHRALAEEYDQTLSEDIALNVDRLLVPASCYERFIPYSEQTWGNTFRSVAELGFRRRLQQRIVSLYRIRGTERCYQVLFRYCGFTLEQVIPYTSEQGLDSPIPLDDAFRRLDSGTSNQREYGLRLTGAAPDNETTRQLIRDIVLFCEPIYARLRDVIYNSVALELAAVLLYLNQQDGYVYFDNENDPELLARVEDGYLYLDGENAWRYRVGDDGYLYYRE